MHIQKKFVNLRFRKHQNKIEQMLEYNTQLKPLVLPEYGRNIQKMVDYCLSIENRDERNRCARAIIASMGALFPALRDGSEENQRKLWDHLAIMSDFKLDIDYPFEPLRPENLISRPDAIPYNEQLSTRRHYGRHILDSIDCALQMPPGEERSYLVHLIANQMKKAVLSNEAYDYIDDKRICADLATLSHGEFRFTPEELMMNDYNITKPIGKKKKKK